jgi:hypothetical protein
LFDSEELSKQEIVLILFKPITNYFAQLRPRNFRNRNL